MRARVAQRVAGRRRPVDARRHSHVAFYSRLFEDVAGLAVFGDEARELLANAAAKYRVMAQ